ncbi:MAG: ABC transporter ATP-binding protein, partial [Candidatus Moranbacteria bacterium]|nr:ABC transporter ATP-binding protein [Candidatus Moranbacteria bacterium]
MPQKEQKEAIIKLTGVNLTYNKGKPNAYQALHNINLEIKRNEFAIIFGPSGCGKSSLLNTISGLENPDEGSVFVDGGDISKITDSIYKANFYRKTTGMIFQSYNLIPTLTVLENVSIPQIFISEGKKNREKKAMVLLERFGIKEHAHKLPTELSGGQQQRIGIARSIINNQPLILADEPVGNLDSKSAANVMQLLNDLRAEDKTIVMVSHNPEHTVWGNHIIYMKDGKVEKEEFKDIEKGISEIKNVSLKEMSQFESMLKSFQGLSKEQIRVLITPMKAKILARSFITDLEENQIDRLEDGVKQRVLNTIGPDIFLKRLDKPEEERGVGMDARTAMKISQKMEEIIKVVEVMYRSDVEDTMRIDTVMKYLIEWEGVRVRP